MSDIFQGIPDSLTLRQTVNLGKTIVKAPDLVKLREEKKIKQRRKLSGFGKEINNRLSFS